MKSAMRVINKKIIDMSVMELKVCLWLMDEGWLNIKTKDTLLDKLVKLSKEYERWKCFE